MNLKKQFFLIFIITIIILSIFNIYGYLKLKEFHKNSFEKEAINSFINLEHNIYDIFKKIEFEYNIKNEKLKQKHKIAYEYFKTHPRDINLNELKNILNQSEVDNTYDVFIINKNYIIENTSYIRDLGLDFSKSKQITTLFDKIFNQEIEIDISEPILESGSVEFQKYSIMLSSDKEFIIQLSMRVDNFKDSHKKLKELKEKIINLKSLNIYYIPDFIVDIFLLEYEKKVAFKPLIDKSKEIFKELKDELNIEDRYINEYLNSTDINRKREILNLIFGKELIYKFTKDGEKAYNSFYTLKNGIFNLSNSTVNMIIIKAIFDDSDSFNEIKKVEDLFILNFIVITIIILNFILFMKLKFIRPIEIITKAIKNFTLIKDKKLLTGNDEFTLLTKHFNFMSEKVNKEIDLHKKLLSEQDKFVKDSIHEIHTPLSIISLNNELRSLEKGEDEYSNTIETAIKMLKNSYEDMSFIIKKDKMAFKDEEIKLSEFLNERVEYFKAIANSHDKEIILNIASHLIVTINRLKLTRVIDNNISNAIKYGENKKAITISLNHNIMEFKSFGKEIKDKNRIFNRYHREDNVKGGYGIGLNIVKEICDEYKIKIEILREDNINIFKYIF